MLGLIQLFIAEDALQGSVRLIIKKKSSSVLSISSAALKLLPECAIESKHYVSLDLENRLINALLMYLRGN
jgi:hypothetical protein